MCIRDRIQDLLNKSSTPQVESFNESPISTSEEEVKTQDIIPTSNIEDNNNVEQKPIQPFAHDIGDTSNEEGAAPEEKVNTLAIEIEEKCSRLNLILKGYGIKANPVDANLVQQAARFTRFKIELRPGETIKKLMDKSQDIARELEAVSYTHLS